MKDYLVDVPVRVMIWIREDCQRKQFEVIKQARPSTLFLISDGGRNEKEWEAIRNNRKIFDEIDWNCKVYKLFEEENNGMYGIGRKKNKLVWGTVDRCIMLEDDQIPSVSYFRYCAELLEKYKDDKRINVICGFNHLGVSEDVTSDYFFARQGAIWGVAMWRRTYEQYHDFRYANDPYALKLLKRSTKHNKVFWKRIVGYSKSERYEGHKPGAEFYIEFGTFGQNQLQIIPKKNMIHNMGCTEDSAHATSYHNLPKASKSLYFSKTYELDFPLKHPACLIPDEEYERKRNWILANNHPLIAQKRRIEGHIKRILHIGLRSEIKYLIKRIKRMGKSER